MTSIALPPDASWPFPYGDYGLSTEAKQVRQRVVDVRLHMVTGGSVTAPHHDTLRGLQDTLTETMQAGWDGYGAQAVPHATALRAFQFVSLLPTTVPPPDVSADPNGRVHFEWQGGPGKAFVVSVGPNDVVQYAGLFGRSKVHGTEELRDELAGAILANLGRALGRVAP